MIVFLCVDDDGSSFVGFVFFARFGTIMVDVLFDALGCEFEISFDDGCPLATDESALSAILGGLCSERRTGKEEKVAVDVHVTTGEGETTRTEIIDHTEVSLTQSSHNLCSRQTRYTYSEKECTRSERKN